MMWCNLCKLRRTQKAMFRSLASLGLWFSLEMRSEISFKMKTYNLLQDKVVEIFFSSNFVTCFLEERLVGKVWVAFCVWWCLKRHDAILWGKLFWSLVLFFKKKNRIEINSIPLLWGALWVWRHQHGKHKSTWWELFKRKQKLIWALKIMGISFVFTFILWND